MEKTVRLIAAGTLFLLLGMSASQAQEVIYSAGPNVPAQNLQGLGFSWADYNQDGTLDLFVEPDNLVRNNSGTSFSRIAASGVAFNVAMVGSMFADINGDGYPDLFTTQGTARPLLYFYNPVTGAFDDSTATSGALAGMTVSGGQMYGLAAADYNRDGYVDITWGAGANSTAGGLRLLRGSAAGFVNVGTTSTAPVIDTSKGFEPWNPHFVDVNNDGYIDLFMPSFRQNLLTTGTGCVVYRNNGNGTFSPLATAGADTGLVVGGVAMKLSAIASAWGDFDNDGIMDLALSALGGEERGTGLRLLKGTGTGAFTDVSAASGITYNNGCRALAWGDYNNDGYIDLLQSKGFAPPAVWRNNGNGTFTDISATLGIPSGGFNTRSVAFIDYDGDGFLDFYGAPSAPGGLWRNGGNINNWIAFKAKAAGKNGMGLGTRFIVYTNGGTTRQIRNIEGGGSGGATGGSVWANFGIGAASSVDSVVVWWPDGSTQKFNALAVNRYWSITQGSVIPAAPVLVSPANGATGQTASLTLSWNAASGATSYRVQVSLDQTFADPTKMAVDATQAGTSRAVALGLGATYYWRVYATSGGFTTVSSVFNFSTTSTAPTQVPTLVSPTSNATNQAGLLTFRIRKTSDAAQYRWQVSTLRTFNTFTFNGLTVDTSNTVQLVAGLKYYWRVRGENGVGMTGFSVVDSFTVMTAPGVPALLSPANNAQNVRADTLVLRWGSQSLATNYAIQVTNVSGTTEYTRSDTTLTLTGLTRLTNYTWRVRAYNIGGSSLFSGSNSFTTIIAAPPAPTLVLPAANATDVARLTRFVWNPALNATKYRLQLATDNTFALIVRDTIGFEDTTLTLARPLGPDSTYFWRVSALNLGGESAFSTSRLFITGLVLAVDESAGIPQEFALQQNYPNPFNPSTTIRYSIPKNAHVRISIYDILGREVASLVNEVQAASGYKIEWNPSGLSSGVYFYRMEAQSQDNSGNFTSVKKLVFMK